METTLHHTSYTKKELAPLLKRADTYTKNILDAYASGVYTAPESSLAIAHDVKYFNALKRGLVKHMGVKHVVLVGIGGSTLGTQAVYDALKTPESPTLMVLDALETRSLTALQSLLKQTKKTSDIALIIVSKSGTTTETVCNAVQALQAFEKKFGDTYTECVIGIGDEGTVFQKMCKRKKISFFTMPICIGGRFSVFTAVGIAPLMLLGIDVVGLRKGGVDAVTKEMLAAHAHTAGVLALQAKRGVHTLNFFSFESRLQTLGFWYRQLLAECIGKPVTKKKKPFVHQLHPTVSTSIDLHSLAQLYLGGYAHILTHFVCGTSEETPASSPEHWFFEAVPSLKNSKYSEVKQAITTGVRAAYDESELPYFHTHFERVDAYHVGFFLASRMAETMYLCDMWDVDAFNQPQVEQYKKHMRNALISPN
jgi:glucose-6-phosphate isomerase